MLANDCLDLTDILVQQAALLFLELVIAEKPDVLVIENLNGTTFNKLTWNDSLKTQALCSLVGNAGDGQVNIALLRKNYV